jgi:hypothetical protein
LSDVAWQGDRGSFVHLVFVTDRSGFAHIVISGFAYIVIVRDTLGVRLGVLKPNLPLPPVLWLARSGLRLS